MTRPPSTRQVELLSLVEDFGGFDGWGEAFSHWSTRMGGQLGMVNFDRISDALIARKLIAVDAEFGTIEVTETGRHALMAADPARWDRETEPMANGVRFGLGGLEYANCRHCHSTITRRPVR